MKRIIIVLILATIISFIMFLIKEQPFKIVPKDYYPPTTLPVEDRAPKVPQEIEEHEHEPGTLPHGH